MVLRQREFLGNQVDLGVKFGEREAPGVFHKEAMVAETGVETEAAAEVAEPIPWEVVGEAQWGELVEESIHREVGAGEVVVEVRWMVARRLRG